jgi:hypothetical protein
MRQSCLGVLHLTKNNISPLITTFNDLIKEIYVYRVGFYMLIKQNYIVFFLFFTIVCIICFNLIFVYLNSQAGAYGLGC